MNVFIHLILQTHVGVGLGYPMYPAAYSGMFTLMTNPFTLHLLTFFLFLFSFVHFRNIFKCEMPY